MKKVIDRKNYNKEESSDKSPYKKNSIYLIPLRYLLLLGIAVSMPILYLIITPITVYPVKFLLKIFIETTLVPNTENINYILILGNKTLIEIVNACVAGSAYLLLLILNLTVPMKIKKRIYSIALSFIILLSLNVIRITSLSLLYHYHVPYVDFTHKIFWYGLSTVFIIVIWFLIVKIFKIREIPVYSDIKHMQQLIRNK